MLYIGLMSGTSLDGVDAVLVDLAGIPQVRATRYHPYSAALRAALLELSHAVTPPLQQLGQIDVELGQLYAQVVLELLDRAAIPPSAITAIGSHGQTVRHNPHGAYPYTLQLGDPNVIAERTGITTIADFRRRDIAAGGQGAPLVPAFHAAIFRSRGHERVILNLGGIANITLLPADSTKPVQGFDTGPANVLLDGWHERNCGTPYDNGGHWGRRGAVLPELLVRLLAEPYFALPPPKSCGREQFNLEWLTARLEGGERPEDVQATLAELTARSVAEAIVHYAAASQEVLVCGGGVRNEFLMHRLAQLMVPRRVQSTAHLGVDPQWIEAMAFAWLAKQRLDGKPGNLPEVTGAQHPVVLGAVFPGTRQCS